MQPCKDTCNPTVVWNAGVQLAKMTPFRSYVVMMYTAGSLSVFSTMNQKQDTMTYVLVSVCT